MPRKAPEDDDNIGDDDEKGGGSVAGEKQRPYYPPSDRMDDVFGSVDDDGFLGLEEGMDPRETFGGDYAYNMQVFRGLLCVSDYQKVLIRAIIQSHLFKSTKDALITIVAGLFDKTEVLAKTKSTFLEYIDVEIILAQARIGFVPSDVDNPQLANITNMILKHYRQFLSRSADGWERGLQNKIETSHTQELRQRVVQEPSKPLRKSIPGIGEYM